MGYLIENFIDQSNTSNSQSNLVGLYGEYLKNYGFDSFVYTFLTDHDLACQKAGHGVLSNYPQDWLNHYLENDYIDNDPVVSCGRKTSDPFTWSQVSNDPTLDKTQIGIMKGAEDSGLHDGVIIPLHRARGEVAGMGLARTQKTEIPDLRTLCILKAITDQFHLCYCELSSKMKNRESLLTPKQKEVLQWLAIDKTAPEIAFLMGISTDTVNYHKKEIYKRLEANSRILAVIKAIRFGIISLDQIKI